MTWDKNSLKSEVKGYADGVKVNWSEIARRYKITNQKGDIAKNEARYLRNGLFPKMLTYTDLNVLLKLNDSPEDRN